MFVTQAKILKLMLQCQLIHISNSIHTWLYVNFQIHKPLFHSPNQCVIAQQVQSTIFTWTWHKFSLCSHKTLLQTPSFSRYFQNPSCYTTNVALRNMFDGALFRFHVTKLSKLVELNVTRFNQHRIGIIGRDTLLMLDVWSSQIHTNLSGLSARAMTHNKQKQTSWYLIMYVCMY